VHQWACKGGKKKKKRKNGGFGGDKTVCGSGESEQHRVIKLFNAFVGKGGEGGNHRGGRHLIQSVNTDATPSIGHGMRRTWSFLYRTYSLNQGLKGRTNDLSINPGKNRAEGYLAQIKNPGERAGPDRGALDKENHLKKASLRPNGGAFSMKSGAKPWDR